MQLQKLLQSLPSPESIAAEAAEFAESREALIKAKTLSVWLDNLESLLKPNVIVEMTEPNFQIMGAKITVSQKREFDYSHDTAWVNAKAAEFEAAQVRKDREKLLQAMTAEMADTQTGEMIQPAQLVSVKSIVSVTLPK